MNGDHSRTLHRALPLSSSVDSSGMLHIGDVGVSDLVAKYGTPLYVYDVADIRSRLNACTSALGSAGSLHYAAKAYLSDWLLRLLDQHDVGIDACSGTELAMALRAGIAPRRIRLHGNNKSAGLLLSALNHDIGAIVVDGMDELRDLVAIARHEGRRARILLRLNPGIEAHTHKYLQTGILDSKFGLPIFTGDAHAAVSLALESHDAVELRGYHAHIGTQILCLEPYAALLDRLLVFAQVVCDETGFWAYELSPGGGIGITYTDEDPPGLGRWITGMLDIVRNAGYPSTPHLSVELGRSIIGCAGVAIYTAGNRKDIPGVRAFQFVDGGMADNIRPALYRARYTALLANRMNDAAFKQLSIAGPYCESGDVLIEDAMLPDVKRGDLIALPASGAYCLPMSSNYNGALRPAVVTVENGHARLVQRRQSLDDLLMLDESFV